MTPVFLFSLPRSGSTLLQRLMVTHPEVATSAEPWFLLPMLSLWENLDCYTNYNHRLARSAMINMASRLPGGVERLREHQRAYCEAVYQDLAGQSNCRYFLDKTPRYHIIAQQIVRTFPDARFVFLWRNPLSVVASMCDTWYGSQWKIYRHQLDLYQGVEELVEASDSLGERACCIRYEELVQNTQETLSRIADYLNLSPFSGELAEKPEGKYGDPTGPARYKEVTKASVDGWNSVFNTPVRKRWAHGYLEWIGEERLSCMGYSLDALRMGLMETPDTWKGAPRDLFNMCRGSFYSAFEPVIFANKWRNFRNGYPAFQHK